MGDEVLDHILLAEPVAAGHGVVEMVVQAVLGQRHRGRAALRRHRMAAHRIDLRDQRNRERGIRLGGGDRRAQSRAARANNQDIGFEMLHGAAPFTQGKAG